MNLRTYFETTGLKQKHLAKVVKMHHVYLNAIVCGRAKPSPKAALRIEQATGGAVTLRELLFPEKPAA